MELFDSYNDLRQQIFDYFGYKEDWRVIPFDDKRDYYWVLHEEKHGGSVYFGEDEESAREGEYIDDIYTQRFLPKWVYRGKDYTMICTDPGVDGNRFLSIFDNSKEIKE